MKKSVKLVVIFACCTMVRAAATASERGAVVEMSAAGDAGTLPQLREDTPLTCGGSSSDVEATFTNPNYPNAETAALGSCQFKIERANDNICQIRLDFTEMVLSQPDNEGVCDQDFVQITGGAWYIPTICGENTGQHMYVNVNSDDCSATINVDTSSVGGKWSIDVRQIECTSLYRAPPGCLQYFNTTTGTIRSFNFNPASAAATDTSQLANQGYGVCINSQPGYCSVTYRQAAGSAFSLSGDSTSLAPGIPPPGLVGTECTTDYLLVPNGQIVDTTNISPSLTSADRFCGLFFPGVTSSIPPFNIYMVTDDGEAASGDSGNQGFELTYRMNPCANAG